MKKNISRLLLDKFGVILYSRAAPEAHCIAVFTKLLAGCSFGRRSTCLLIFSLEKKSTRKADEHTVSLEVIFDVVENVLDNLVALVGKDFSVNQYINSKPGINLVGCASYNFRLEVKEVLSAKKSKNANVHQLIKKLRTSLLSAKLRRETHLRPKFNNTTRWNSTYKMLQEHMKLCKHVP